MGYKCTYGTRHTVLQCPTIDTRSLGPSKAARVSVPSIPASKPAHLACFVEVYVFPTRYNGLFNEIPELFVTIIYCSEFIA